MSGEIHPCIPILEDGARRVDTPTYPEEVTRETIVNALIHRDYLLSGTDIELAIYEDRLEVISPGKLPNGITPERMRLGTRAARNSLLKDFMRDYRYLEHMGMGVPRKIIKGMKEHNGSDPQLIEENERFTVRLFSAKHSQTDIRNNIYKGSSGALLNLQIQGKSISERSLSNL